MGYASKKYLVIVNICRQSIVIISCLSGYLYNKPARFSIVHLVYLFEKRRVTGGRGRKEPAKVALAPKVDASTSGRLPYVNLRSTVCLNNASFVTVTRARLKGLPLGILPKGDPLKESRFALEQIAGIIAEANKGKAVSEIAREQAISTKTFYSWRRKFGGMDATEAKRLKALEDENLRLKQIVANLTLDNTVLKELLGKKW